MEIKQHDTARRIQHTLSLNGAALNLTGCTVKVLFRGTGDVAEIDATVDTPTSGIISWQPTENEVGEPCTAELEFRITYPTGKVLTVPTSSRTLITINPALA